MILLLLPYIIFSSIIVSVRALFAFGRAGLYKSYIVCN